MFEKIKDALSKPEKTSNSAFSHFMRFPAGHTYTLRLIPNVENVDDTFFHHYLNNWKSNKDGSFVSTLSLKTFGEKDPISDYRWKLYKHWKDTGEGEVNDKGNFKNPIQEKEAWLVNVYVIDDPANPENNGTVRILSMGPQLKEKVDKAIGDRADEYGIRIFDLSSDGCDFKIEAAEQGIYTTYKDSYFTTKSKLKLTDEEIDEIYGQVHDLKQIYTAKTYDELVELLDDQFICGEDITVETKKEVKKPLATKKSKGKAKVEEPSDSDDEIPMFHDDDTPSEEDDEELANLIAEIQA